jgi:trimeric autotransporter adhesin
MSTYTPSLGLELITPGSQAGLWGNTTNNTFNLIDQAITGVTPISFAAASGSTYTLTDFNGAEDESRSAVLNITGSAIGANTIVIPNKQKTYLVRNNTGQDVTFRTATPSATFAVGAGFSILIFCDGNNNVFTGIASPGVGTLSVNAGGTGATTFTAGFVKSTGGTNALTSSATVNAASELSGAVPVANGGTGQTSLTSGALLVGNGTGSVAVLSGGTAGYVATWNGSTWVSAPSASAGVSSISAGTGISASGSTNVTISNTGVTSLTAGTGISLSGSTGGITISATGGSGPTLSATQTWTGVNTYTQRIVSSQGFAIIDNITTLTGSSSALSFNAGGVNVGSINSSGNLFITGPNATKASGTTWINPSDQRLKDNVVDYTEGLSKAMQIQPKTWTFNGKGGTTAGLKGVGVIADQVQSVLPNTVSTYKAKLNESDAAETDIKQFNADEIIWVLLNSVKELKAEVDALKAAK